MYVDNSQPSDASMILVMGVTGSGKSHFINQLAGKNVVEESAKLYSCRTLGTSCETELIIPRY